DLGLRVGIPAPARVDLLRVDEVVGAGARGVLRVVLGAVLVADAQAAGLAAGRGVLERADRALGAAPGPDARVRRRVGLLGDDVDHAEAGVGAVEHGVGPAHDLDALDVLHLDGQALPVNAAEEGAVHRAPVDEHLHLGDE